MKETISIIISILIFILFGVLLFLNYILIESGFEPPSVTIDDGQAGMGVAIFVLSSVLGIGSAVGIIGLTLIKRLLAKVFTKIDFGILILSTLLLFLDLYIYVTL